MEEEGIWTRKVTAQNAIDGVVHYSIAGDFGQVGADERELLGAIHPLDLIEAIDSFLAEKVAAQAVHRVARVCDDFPGLQGVARPADLSWFRVLRVDLEKHWRCGVRCRTVVFD